MRLLLTGARVLDPDGELDRPPPQDVLIEDGRIVAVGSDIGADGAERLDAAGCLLTPGFVNAHSHSHDALLRGRFEAIPLDVWGLGAFPGGWSRRSVDEIALRTTLHAAECLLGGITTVQDMVSLQGPDPAHLNAVLEAYRTSGIRAVVALQFADRALAETVPVPTMLDGVAPPGAPASMGDFVRSHLEPAPRLQWGLGPSAPQRCSEALLRWTAALARERGLPVFTHLYETRAQAVHAQAYGSHAAGLDGFEHLVVAHGVWIMPDEIARLGAAGAFLACNPVANLKLLNGVAPVRAYAEAGVRIALGCDNTSASDAQNIFQAMKAFALAWAMQGGPDPAAHAFRAATTGGASALGLPDIGRIRPGATADLVLFDLGDPAWWPLNSAVRQLVYAETGRSVRHVIVDGEIVVRDRVLLTADTGSLAIQAEAARDRMDPELAAMGRRDANLRRALQDIHARAAAVPLGIDRMRLAR
ncbi:MAG: amidohydrolase family protein [Janthinobacterium lividum]